MKFTKEQLDYWRKYEHVRKGGKFNMFSLNARKCTGLSKVQYMFVIKNYTELKNEALTSGDSV